MRVQRKLLLTCVLLCFCVGKVVCRWDLPLGDSSDVYVFNRALGKCEKAPLGRVPWILHVRNSDFGWDENTHRARIALAVNKYRGSSDEEMRKMELQLEVEITKALFLRDESGIHDNDLALFIHALIATCKNPRDFHGTDLVEDLLHRVDIAIHKRGVVHPFLVLALCNSGVVTIRHLEHIKDFTQHENHDHTRMDLDGRKTELKALALKAYACAASLDQNLDKFPVQVSRAVDCLTRRQNENTDGSFGNVYTTSLAVQALTACRHPKCRNSWNEDAAIQFLLGESERNVNMIKAYYIEMALNARSVNYVKDLCGKIWTPPVPPETHIKNYVQYTVRDNLKPDYYFTVTMNVKPLTNFFEIMKIAAGLSDRFRFSSTLNHEQRHMVNKVAGIPNDAEENLFWRICRQKEVNGDRSVAPIINYHDSPEQLQPEINEHIILWYRSTECPPK